MSFIWSDFTSKALPLSAISMQTLTTSSRDLNVPPGFFHSFLSPTPSSPLPPGWQVLQDLPAVPLPSFGSLKSVLPRSSGRCFIANTAEDASITITTTETIFSVFIGFHLLSSENDCVQI